MRWSFLFVFTVSSAAVVDLRNGPPFEEALSLVQTRATLLTKEPWTSDADAVGALAEVEVEVDAAVDALTHAAVDAAADAADADALAEVDAVDADVVDALTHAAVDASVDADTVDALAEVDPSVPEAIVNLKYLSMSIPASETHLKATISKVVSAASHLVLQPGQHVKVIASADENQGKVGEIFGESNGRWMVRYKDGSEGMYGFEEIGVVQAAAKAQSNVPDALANTAGMYYQNTKEYKVSTTKKQKDAISAAKALLKTKAKGQYAKVKQEVVKEALTALKELQSMGIMMGKDLTNRLLLQLKKAVKDLEKALAREVVSKTEKKLKQVISPTSSRKTKEKTTKSR